MIAKDLLDYLGEALSVGVYMESPEELTNYVLLDQTGSSRNDHIVTTTIEHDHKAVSLAGRVQHYSLLGGTKWHRQ